MLKDRIFLFRYYGGKSKIAHLYPSPIYETIIEPFAGAANYSCLHFEKKVVLFEKNPVIFGVLDFLIKASEKDILSIPLLKVGQSVKELSVSEEVRNLIGLMCVAGAPKPQFKITSMALKSRTVWSSRFRFQLSCFVKRIKHWDVHLGSCWNAFEQFKDQDVTWFIDPPYQGSKGKAYPCSSSDLDFKKLGLVCQRLKGQVIICEGEEADWMPFKKFYLNRQTSSTKGGQWEMIWTNGCKKPMGFGL